MTGALLVVDIEVSTPTGKLFLNQSPYSLAGETWGSSQVSHRKHEVSNPFVEGTYAINSLRENLVTPVSIWVRGATHEAMYEALQTLRAAFDQSTFAMTMKMEDHTQSYLCFASDYSISSQREFLHSRVAKLDVQVNHYPEPQPTNQASDGHSHSEYAPLDSPHLTGQPRVPVPLTTSNDDQVPTTSWVKTVQGTAYVAKAGDTMTGALTVDSDITGRTSLKIGPAGVEVIVSRPADNILNIAAGLSVANDVVSGGNLRGQWGLFTGGVDLGNQRAVNVATPVDPSDAVNKAYADLALAKDTGWMMVEPTAGTRNWTKGFLTIRRIGSVVYLALQNAVVSNVEPRKGIYVLPVGFRTTAPIVVSLVDETSGTLVTGVCRYALVLSDLMVRNKDHMLSGSWSYVTDDDMPEVGDG